MTQEEIRIALREPTNRADPGALLAASGLESCRWDVVNRALRDASLLPPSIPREESMWRLFGRWMLTLRGERHTRMRGRFAGLFGPRQAPSFRASIEARADALLDEVVEAGRMDVVTAFARPLPFAVICDVLGVPPALRPSLATQYTRLGLGFANQSVPAFVRDASEAADSLVAAFSALLDEREADPRDDLLSALMEKPPLDPEERADLVANAIFLVEAGHATTASLISAGLLRLLARPELMAAFRDGTADTSPIIEELLRLITPTTVVPRCAEAQPMTMYYLAGANRDPAVFSNPDELDTARSPNPHLAFSAGRHFCLGAPLARLHGEVALRALLRRLPNVRLDGAPEWRSAAPIHELEHLPVAWDTP